MNANARKREATEIRMAVLSQDGQERFNLGSILMINLSLDLTSSFFSELPSLPSAT